MKALLLSFTVVLALCVIPTTATVYCYDTYFGTSWYCSYSCCHSYSGCCTNYGSLYWYAWVIIVIFILLCVCACAGGGYGYRRYYYVRRVHYPPPTATTVIATSNTTNQGYHQFANPPPAQYQPYEVPKNAPPPYQPQPPKY